MVLDTIGEKSDVYDGAKVAGGGESAPIEPHITVAVKDTVCKAVINKYSSNRENSTILIKEDAHGQEMHAPLALALTEGIEDVLFPGKTIHQEDWQDVTYIQPADTAQKDHECDASSCVSNTEKVNMKSCTAQQTATPRFKRRRFNTQQSQRQIGVDSGTYNNLVNEEINKVKLEKELVQQKMNESAELSSLDKKLKLEMHEAQMQLLQKQTEVYTLQAELIRNQLAALTKHSSVPFHPM